MSRPIADEVQRILEHSSSETLVHGVAYESDFKYLLFSPEDSNDTRCEVAWVFSTLGDVAPVLWRKPVPAARVMFTEDRLYLVNDDLGYVVQERKDFDPETDFLDEGLDATVDAVTTWTDESGTTLTSIDVSFASAPAPLVPGCAFRKTPSSLPWAKVLEVDQASETAFTLRLDTYFPGLTTGTGVVASGIKSRVRWHPETADNAAVLKAFITAVLYFEEASMTRCRLAFFSDLDPVETFVRTITLSPRAGGDSIRCSVPRDFARCRGLSFIFEHDVALEDFTLLELAFNLRMTSDLVTRLPT